MTPPISCYDGLVPANFRDVLLSLPDVTRTFYAAVQIVRNFNGHELVEDKYSKVSTAFCTGELLLVVTRTFYVAVQIVRNFNC